MGTYDDTMPDSSQPPGSPMRDDDPDAGYQPTHPSVPGPGATTTPGAPVEPGDPKDPGTPGTPVEPPEPQVVPSSTPEGPSPIPTEEPETQPGYSDEQRSGDMGVSSERTPPFDDDTVEGTGSRGSATEAAHGTHPTTRGTFREHAESPAEGDTDFESDIGDPLRRHSEDPAEG